MDMSYCNFGREELVHSLICSRKKVAFVRGVIFESSGVSWRVFSRENFLLGIDKAALTLALTAKRSFKSES